MRTGHIQRRPVTASHCRGLEFNRVTETRRYERQSSGSGKAAVEENGTADVYPVGSQRVAVAVGPGKFRAAAGQLARDVRAPPVGALRRR